MYFAPGTSGSITVTRFTVRQELAANTSPAAVRINTTARVRVGRIFATSRDMGLVMRFIREVIC